jgi:hypothetical protein
MNRHIKEERILARRHQPLDNHEVPGAADRKKLGQPLHDAQQNRSDRIHQFLSGPETERVEGIPCLDSAMGHTAA